jgi:hypothetical protein
MDTSLFSVSGQPVTTIISDTRYLCVTVHGEETRKFYMLVDPTSYPERKGSSVEIIHYEFVTSSNGTYRIDCVESTMDFDSPTIASLVCLNIIAILDKAM